MHNDVNRHQMQMYTASNFQGRKDALEDLIASQKRDTEMLKSQLQHTQNDWK